MRKKRRDRDSGGDSQESRNHQTAVTHQDYSDGLDSVRVTTVRLDRDTPEDAAARVAHAHEWAARLNATQPWTFEGAIRRAEAYWRAVPADRKAKPFTKERTAHEIQSEIDFVRGRLAMLRRVATGEMKPSADDAISPADAAEFALVSAFLLGAHLLDAQWRFNRGEDVKNARKARSQRLAAKENAVSVRRANSQRSNEALTEALQRLENSSLSERALAEYLHRKGFHGVKKDLKNPVDALRARIRAIRKQKMGADRR